jgi:hypothetical protein
VDARASLSIPTDALNIRASPFQRLLGYVCCVLRDARFAGTQVCFGSGVIQLGCVDQNERLAHGSGCTSGYIEGQAETLRSYFCKEFIC